MWSIEAGRVSFRSQLCLQLDEQQDSVHERKRQTGSSVFLTACSAPPTEAHVLDPQHFVIAFEKTIAPHETRSAGGT